MNCSKLHDSLHDLFCDIDSEKYRTALKTAYQNEEWSALLGVSGGRDAAINHASECSDCLNDLLAYLEIRDAVDYREYPCLHLAYYSTVEAVRCIDNDYGFFSIRLPENEAIGIGCCPWCGISFPTSHAEMAEAKKTKS